MDGRSRPLFLLQYGERMFPIRDTVRSWSFPIVNYALIAFNVLVFLFESSLGPNGFNRLLFTLGLTPANLTSFQPISFLTLLTSMFLHGSWFHLISNMWTLYIFGDNVEDRMGSGRYLAFYLLSGSLAGLSHAFVTCGVYGSQSPVAMIPTIGASGALASVLGAYFVLYPNARVTTFVPLFILPWFIDVPAFIFIGVWFVSQLSSGLLSLGAYGAFGGIAWWAHIGGFAVGVVLVRLFTRRRKLYRAWYPDEYWPW
jgi:membrane associated rhomboid family serine protease